MDFLRRVMIALTLLITGGFFNVSTIYGQCNNIDFQANKTKSCINQITFSATGIPNNSTLHWDFGEGEITKQDTFIKEFFQSKGFYDVDLRVVLPNGNECNVQKSDYIQIGVNPNADFQVSDTLLCNGPGSVTFTDTSDAIVQRDWVIGGQDYTDADSQITHNFSSPGYKDAILITQDSLGCNYYLQKDSAVYIPPQVGVNFSTNDATSGCSPLNNIQITPSLNQNGQTLNQYKWYFPGSNVDSVTDANDPAPPAVSYDSSGTYDVTFEVESSLNCTYSTTKSDFIQGGDLIGVDFSSNVTNVCSGGTITFANESDSSEANAPGSFSWGLDGGNVVSSSTDTQEVQFNSTGDKTISLSYDHNGCTNSETKTDYIFVKGVTADFTADSTQNCQPPLTTHFTDQSSSQTDPGGSITSHEWTFFDKTGDNVLGNSTNQNDSFTYDSANGFGSYSVKLKVDHSNGCSDSITKTEVATIEEPMAQFNAEHSAVCPQDTIEFSNDTEAYSTSEENETFDWYVYDEGFNVIDSAKDPDEFGYRFHDSTGNYSFELITYDGQGCNDTLFDTNTVKVTKPAINYTIGQKQVCGGVSINFAASDSSNLPLNYTFDFSNKDTLFSRQGNDVNTVFPAPGKYNVKLTGKADTFCIDSLSKTDSVKINNLGGDFVIDSTKGCSPLTTQVKPTNFQISNVNNNDSIQYTWSGSPGVSFAKDSGIVDTANIQDSITTDVTVTGNGNFTITLDANNLEGCSQTITKNGAISLGTSANFNMPSNACLNDTVQLSNQSPTTDNSQWINNDAGLEFQPFDIATNPEIAFSDTGTYGITLVSTSQLGCQDTITDSITVEKVTVDFAAQDTFRSCAPQIVKFQGSATNATQFNWEFGDNTGTETTSSPSNNHLYEQNTGDTAQGGFDVTLIGTNNTGCSDTLSRKNYIQIIGPAPEFTMSNHQGCEPQTVTFTDSSKNVETFYFDYGRGLPTDSNKINPRTYQTKANSPYTAYKPSMYAFGPSGCPPRTFEPEDSIIAYKRPRAQFSADPNKACNPVEVQFSDSTTYGDDYEWDFQDDGSFDDSVKNPTHTYSQPGTYSVFMRVTTQFGCQDSMLQTDTITSYPVPKPDFETADTFLCYGEDLNLTNLTSSTNSITDYTWNFGDDGATNDTSDQENPAPYSYQAKGPATVSLAVEDVNSCNDTMVKTDYVLVDREILPPTTELNYVSVEDSNRVNLNWQQNPINDFVKYFINRKEPSTTFSRYDSVQNQNDTSYLDVLSNQSANAGPLCYTIETSDQCRNISNPGQEHCTVHLTISNPAPAQNLLDWTAYSGWTDVDRYSIYRKTEDTSNFSLLTEVPGDSTQYLDEPLCNERYCYYIIAHHPNEDFTSKSNQACQEPPYELQEEPLELNYTTVVNDSFTLTSWEPGTQSNIDEYIVDRYQLPNGWEEEYATLQSTQFEDLPAQVNRSPYRYRVSVKDQCGNVSEPSNVGSSILLQSINKDEAVQLKWTPYENWKSGVQNYSIQALKDNGQFEEIATVPSEDSSYVDDDLEFETVNGYCYRVVAKQQGLENDSSASNTSCTIIPSRVYIPSGFSPNGNGLNETFGVVAKSVRDQANEDGLEFTFKVFNRWGQMVFETNDLDEKWDGTIDGEPAPTGTYHYFLEAYGKDQKQFFIEGKVKLIR